MSFNDVMHRMLPPINGISPHVTGEFGEHRANKPHGGTDFNYVGGQSGINLQHPTIYSPIDGEVTFVGGSYGTVKIKDANGNSHEILHTETQLVSLQQNIKAGDAIGTMGGRGPVGSTQYAQHVHYQLKDSSGKILNPQQWWDNQTGLSEPKITSEANFQFPIRKSNGQPYQDAEELFSALEKESTGHFLLGNHGFWHGGIHISELSAPQCKQREPIRCIADGEVIAYRLNNDYLSSVFQGESSCDNLRYSTSFCIVRHTHEVKRPPEKKPELKIDWIGRTVKLRTSRNGRDVASTSLGEVGDFEALMPSGTELQIIKLHDAENMRFALAKIKTPLEGKDRCGTKVTRPADKEIWFAALDKNNAILKGRDRSPIFEDITSPPPTASVPVAEPRPESNSLTFYSLYMHLLPYERYAPAEDETPTVRLKVIQGGWPARNVPLGDAGSEKLGTISTGTEFDVLEEKDTADGRYRFTRARIVKGKIGAKKEGDEVWFASQENGSPIKNNQGKERLQEVLPPERTRPGYWKGIVEAVVTAPSGLKVRAAPDGEKLGAQLAPDQVLCTSSVIRFDSAKVHWLKSDDGKQFPMAECTLVSGGLKGAGTLPPTFWVCVADTGKDRFITRKNVIPKDFDRVVATKTAIKAGDPIGYLGLYETPAGPKGGKHSKHQVHIEVFTDDARLQSFLKNDAGIKTGRQYLRLLAGTALYSQDVLCGPQDICPTYTLRADHAIELSKAKTLKDQQGQAWYEVSVHEGQPVTGLIRKPNELSCGEVEIISQHDWEKLGFRIVEEKNSNADGFLDPERMPDFFQSLYQEVDRLGDKNGQINQAEFKTALRDPLMRDRWSKLIAYHPTEWQAKSCDPKWQRLKDLLKDVPDLLRHEQERIDNLAFWDELQMALQLSLPSKIYHLHPIAFISALQKPRTITKNLTKEQFVKLVHDAALVEESRSGVPAAITTAQAILETGYGRAVPIDINNGKYSYNLFGIKAHGHPDFVEIWTHEEVNGRRIKILDKFRSYSSFEDSIRGRTEFFIKNKRYHDLLDSTDSFFWADELQKRGYATDSEYAKKLKSIIKSWDLK